MPPVIVALAYITALAFVLVIAATGSWLIAIAFGVLLYLLLRELPTSHLFDDDADDHEKDTPVPVRSQVSSPKR